MVDIFKSLPNDDRWFTATILIVVAVASFGLGRLSNLDLIKTETRVTLATSSRPTVVSEASTTLGSEEEGSDRISLVASKNGTKYHLPSCPGAKQIAEQNKITFTSSAAARAAGYTPAANCPGLR